MRDPIADLKHELLAAAERQQRQAASVGAGRRRLRVSLRRNRLLLTAATVAVVAAAALLFAAPWNSSPGFLERAQAAVAPPPGSILHVKWELTSTSNDPACTVTHGPNEIWIDQTPPHRYRVLLDESNFGGADLRALACSGGTGSRARRNVRSGTAPGRLASPSHGTPAANAQVRAAEHAERQLRETGRSTSVDPVKDFVSRSAQDARMTRVRRNLTGARLRRIRIDPPADCPASGCPRKPIYTYVDPETFYPVQIECEDCGGISIPGRPVAATPHGHALPDVRAPPAPNRGQPRAHRHPGAAPARDRDDGTRALPAQAERSRSEDGARGEGGEGRPRDLRGDGHRRAAAATFPSRAGRGREAVSRSARRGAMRGDGLQRQHRHGGVHGDREATAMTRRKDVTGMSTNRILLLASFGVTAALLLVLAPTARSTAQDASAEAQKRCAKGAVAATIAGKRVCLKSGQKCKSSRDWQYHRYGFHCHTGRLVRAAKPKPSDAVSRKIDVGGYRLAITCRGKGSPTVILESGGGVSAEAWFLMERILSRTTRVCSYDRAGLGVSDARRPPGPVPAARVVEELHALLAGLASRRRTSSEAGPSVASSIACTRSATPRRWWVSSPSTERRSAFPASRRAQPAWFATNRPARWAGLPRFVLLAAAGAELAAAPDLGSRPFVVLTHGRADGLPDDFEALWLHWQKQRRPAVGVVDPPPRRLRRATASRSKLPTWPPKHSAR